MLDQKIEKTLCLCEYLSMYAAIAAIVPLRMLNMYSESSKIKYFCIVTNLLSFYLLILF